METGRRIFISNFGVALAGAKSLLAASQGQGRGQAGSPRIPRVPDASGSAPADDPSSFPQPDPKEQLKESQKNLRRDADQLLELANDLKDEAYKTEQTDVLSLSLVHKAEEVEKLAKRIKDLVRAA